MGHHLVSVFRYEIDQIIMAMCRIFDVITQLSALQECDMIDCIPSKVGGSVRQAIGLPSFSLGDNPSYHTLTRLIIV
jgi:hypothetical protein